MPASEVSTEFIEQELGLQLAGNDQLHIGCRVLCVKGGKKPADARKANCDGRKSEDARLQELADYHTRYTEFKAANNDVTDSEFEFDAEAEAAFRLLVARRRKSKSVAFASGRSDVVCLIFLDVSVPLLIHSWL